MTSDRNFVKQLKGYSLTTAEILYHMPDHQHLLQSFIWQEYDQVPDLPRLRKFLDFWTQNLDGPLHSVRYSAKKLISASEWRNVSGELRLN